MQSPLLAAITLHPTGGGVAVVAELLWRVLQRGWGPRARLATIFDDNAHRPSAAEKARFAVNVVTAQATSAVDWVLYAHLGPALVQAHLPVAIRRPYAVFLHGIEAWRPLTTAQRRLLAAAVRITNSHYTANRISAAHPGIGPIAVCPLALPPRPHLHRGPADAALLRRLGSRVVLVVGRMSAAERYKGHDQLIAAWPGVLARVPDSQLVIAGDGDDRARLTAEVAARGLSGSVIFPGFVTPDTLSALYDHCALFALPSRGEGFGLVYLEAMCHGKACVGSVHDAAAEVIEDGVTGRLVVQDDISGISRTLAALLLDDEARERLGRTGEARLQRLFSFEQFERRISELLGAPSNTSPVQS